VEKYQFISKADALKIMRKRQPDLTADLPSNPLPASYTVTPTRPEDVKMLSQDIRQQFRSPKCSDRGAKVPTSGVECVKDGEQTSERILQVARAIEVVFLVAVIVLLIASVLLIANTIRLSIFSRRREIEVMKLVGATNWFVRGPFMLEGLLCGAVGALSAVLLLLLGKEFALPAILGRIETSDDVEALGFGMMALILLAVGLGVGALGSGMTLRRYLRV
jgi:cell division transport system permease protein